MMDKTQLELDIEERERYRASAGVKILIVLLIIGLCTVGAFTLNIKKELLKKEQEILLLNENFQREKEALLSRIKQLEAEHALVKSK